jgi:hypothetical protein
MLFIEKESRYSPYIKFEDFDSLSADVPKLSILRVEMERIHPGMSDFIMRVATPRYGSVKKSGTVLSIRGTKSFTKFDTALKLAKTIGKEMSDKNDQTFEWKSLDAEHLANMMYGAVKYFAMNARVEKLNFSTEALA